MRKMLLLLLILLAPVQLESQRMTPETAVIQKLFDLIKTHPDAKLRSDIQTWYSQGKFRVLVDAAVPDLAWAMCFEQGKQKLGWPCLQVNPRFFGQTHVPVVIQKQDLKAVTMERYGFLYHEYCHMLNHFNRKHPMILDEKKFTLAKQAEENWSGELEPYWGQYQFLKQVGYAHLYIKPEYAKLGEWEAFARSTYSNLRADPRYEKFRLYWDRFFQELLKHPR